MSLDSAFQWFPEARQESGFNCQQVTQTKTLIKLWQHLLKWGRSLMSSPKAQHYDSLTDFFPYAMAVNMC